jgi:hypothetical protein
VAAFTAAARLDHPSREWDDCGVRRSGIFLVVLIGLVVAAQAQAAVRFAEPGGDGPEPCLQSDPCDIQVAVEAVAVQNGDEVVLLPGDYALGVDPLAINDTINLHGQAGQPRPRLTGTGLPLLSSASNGDNSTVSDLELVKPNAGIALQIFQAPMTVERVVVTSGGFGACNPATTGAVIRDSVCWQTGSGSAVEFNLFGPATHTTKLRNVTAIASGSGTSLGLHLDANNGANLTFDAKNVIAEGATADVRAQSDGDPGSAATITLANSNYATADTVGPATSVTPAGTGTNQTAAPLLANPAGGDFHQLVGSPTIDGGTSDPDLGATDLDGQPRSLGAVPDIGADEFDPGPPEVAPEVDSDPPETEILKGPKKKTKKRKAKFEFGSDEPGSTFQCRLDKADFEPCDASEQFKVKRKKHTLRVRAKDPAGNVDPTPAQRKWKVKKKR